MCVCNHFGPYSTRRLDNSAVLLSLKVPMLRGLARCSALLAMLVCRRFVQGLKLSDPGPNNLATFSFHMPQSATCPSSNSFCERSRKLSLCSKREIGKKVTKNEKKVTRT